jgi:hypothetical protein
MPNAAFLRRRAQPLRGRGHPVTRGAVAVNAAPPFQPQ